MNTLKDTLNDLIVEIINRNPEEDIENDEQLKWEIIREYSERIIDELNIKKYLL